MRERPVSITIFGILNIGFGLLGMAEALVSIIAGSSGLPAGLSSMSPFIASMVALWDTISADAAFVIWRQITIPLDAAASLALLAAGIGLLLLKNWARLVSFGWSIYTIIFAFLNLAVLFVVLHRVLANALPNTPGSSLAFVIGAGVAGAVLTLVYPVLLVFFLKRPKAVAAFQSETIQTL